MTHASIPKEVPNARGVANSLVLLSFEIEDREDLMVDIDQAVDEA